MPVRLFWTSALFLSGIAYGDTLSITGTCSSSPCSVENVDQYGEVWSTASVDISQIDSLTLETGPPILLPAIDDGVSGIVQTTLGLVNEFEHLHPGTYERGADVNFTAALTIPQNVPTIDVYVYWYGTTDECIGCAPSLQISGVAGATGEYYQDDYTVYTDVPNPGEIEASSSVSTIIYESTDTLSFTVAYSIVPEAGAGVLTLSGLLGIGALGLFAKHRLLNHLRK